MKTVAYVIRPAEGGMLRHLLDLISHLDRERFTPVVLSPPGNDLEEPLSHLGAELIEVDIADRPNLARDAASITRLATQLTALGPDIIHAHSNKAALLVEMAARRGSLPASIVFSVHNFPSYIASGSLKKMVASLAMRRVINGADAVIAVSRSLKDYLVDAERTEPAKVSVVYNGIDAAAFDAVKPAEIEQLRSRLGIDHGAPVIGTVGRLIPSKGIDTLIKAAPDLIHKVPGLKIVIAGSGPLEQSLRAAAASLGLTRDIIFVGHVPDLRPYYALFDAFALPTRLEAFGLVLVEAMAAGCPVVATRTGGIPEIVKNRETGLLVPPDDPLQLAAALRIQLTDTRGAKKMAARGQIVARENFTLPVMAAATQAIYDKVASKDDLGTT
jgi:glycosyltransferase involved in cell wall biosynthesis